MIDKQTESQAQSGRDYPMYCVSDIGHKGGGSHDVDYNNCNKKIYNVVMVRENLFHMEY